MKYTSSTYRIGFLTLVLGFVSFVLLSPAAVLAEPTTITDTENYWTGQELTYSDSSFSESDIVELVTDDENETLIAELRVSETGQVTFDTETYDMSGQYKLVFPNEDTVSFTVLEHTFEVDISDDTISSSVTEPQNLEISDNRGSYMMHISEPSLSTTELEQIFGVTSQHNSEYQIAASDLQSINPDALDQGSYEFTFEATDSTASDSLDIFIWGPETAEISVETSSDTLYRGENYTFDITGEDIEQYTVTLSDSSGSSLSEFTIEQSSINETNTIEFNSHTATVNNTEQSIEIIDGNGSIVDVSGTNSIEWTNEPLTLSVSVSNIEQSKTDIPVEPLQVSNSTMKSVASSLEDPSIKTSSITTEDTAVFTHNIRGISGYVDSSVTTSDITSNSTGITITLLEEPSSVNDTQTEISTDGVNVEYTPSNNTLSILLPYNSDIYEINEEYTIEFRISEDNPHTSQTIQRSQTFSFVEPSVELAKSPSGAVEYQPQTETISGTTNLAPTNTITISANGNTSSADVTTKQTFSGALSFEDLNEGDSTEITFTPSTDSYTASIVSNLYTVTVNTQTDAQEPIDATVELGEVSQQTTDGSTTFKNVSNGSYTVSAAAGERDATDSVEVTDNSTITLTLRDVHPVDYTFSLQSERNNAIEGSINIAGESYNTDDSGVVTISLLPGSYTAEITPTNPDIQTQTKDITISEADQGGSISEEISLKYEQFTYTIFVVDSNGNSIPDATVDVYAETAQTNEDGVAKVELPKYIESESVDISVSSDYYIDYSESVTISSTTKTIRLQQNYGGEMGVLLQVIFIVLTVVALAGLLIWLMNDSLLETDE